MALLVFAIPTLSISPSSAQHDLHLQVHLAVYMSFFQLGYKSHVLVIVDYPPLHAQGLAHGSCSTDIKIEQIRIGTRKN